MVDLTPQIKIAVFGATKSMVEILRNACLYREYLILVPFNFIDLFSSLLNKYKIHTFESMNLIRESLVVIMATLLFRHSMPVTFLPFENFPLLFLHYTIFNNASFSSVESYIATSPLIKPTNNFAPSSVIFRDVMI